MISLHQILRSIFRQEAKEHSYQRYANGGSGREITDFVSPVAMHMAAATQRADIPISKLPMAQNCSSGNGVHEDSMFGIKREKHCCAMRIHTS